MEKRSKLQFLGALTGLALMGGVIQTAHARIIDLERVMNLCPTSARAQPWAA